jgi:hypothetical protein
VALGTLPAPLAFPGGMGCPTDFLSCRIDRVSALSEGRAGIIDREEKPEPIGPTRPPFIYCQSCAF